MVNVTTGDTNVKVETGDQNVTVEQKQKQEQSQSQPVVAAATKAAPAAQGSVAGTTVTSVPVTAKTGAGLLGLVSTVLGGAGLAFVRRLV